MLFVQGQPCARTLKYASALAERHPEVRLAFAYQGLTLEWLLGGGRSSSTWFRVPTIGAREGLTRRSNAGAPTSNPPPQSAGHARRPRGLGAARRQGAIPVVHDVHDMWSLRRTEYEDGLPEAVDPATDEKRAIEGASTVVASRTDGPRDPRPPSGVRPAVDLWQLRHPRRAAAGADPRRDRLVYEGTLTTTGDHPTFARVLPGLRWPFASPTPDASGLMHVLAGTAGGGPDSTPPERTPPRHGAAQQGIRVRRMRGPVSLPATHRARRHGTRLGSRPGGGPARGRRRGHRGRRPNRSRDVGDRDTGARDLWREHRSPSTALCAAFG